MDHSQPKSQQSVKEVLNTWPQAVDVFRTFKTSCVGCYLARFCTLEDVAATYKLGLDPFLEKLNEVIDLQTKGATNENL